MLLVDVWCVGIGAVAWWGVVGCMVCGYWCGRGVGWRVLGGERNLEQPHGCERENICSLELGVKS